SSGVVFRIFTCGSVNKAVCSALTLRILGFALAHRLTVSTSGSATVGRPPGVFSPSFTMAPPSIGSTVDHHHDCGLGLA
ncbi:hypothetical protein M9458_057680, partial [Cirrhinus mrigala]